MEPWAYAIARRLTLDYWARQGNRTAVVDAADSVASLAVDPEGAATGAQLERALVEEMEAISPQRREAFVLTRIHGLSIAEAAEALGATVAATKLNVTLMLHQARPRARMLHCATKRAATVVSCCWRTAGANIRVLGPARSVCPQRGGAPGSVRAASCGVSPQCLREGLASAR